MNVKQLADAPPVQKKSKKLKSDDEFETPTQETPKKHVNTPYLITGGSTGILRVFDINRQEFVFEEDRVGALG